MMINKLHKMEQVNLLIAVTNFVAIIPIIRAFIYEEYALACLIFLMMTISFISHLAEKRHGLPGYCFIEYFDILNFADILVAIILILNRMYSQHIFNEFVITSGLTAIGFWILASLSGDNMYEWSIFHSIWHVTAFITLTFTIY